MGIQTAQTDAIAYVGGDAAWKALNAPRKKALTDLSFQLGAHRLSQFAKMRSAIQAGDQEAHTQSSAPARDSMAATTVPSPHCPLTVSDCVWGTVRYAYRQEIGPGRRRSSGIVITVSRLLADAIVIRRCLRAAGGGGSAT